MTRIINLYAGPGTGKSTSAAYIYFRLKYSGRNAELVREYVKDWAWEGRTIGTYEQLYILGKQVRREAVLLGKVDYIVTDSPVWLAPYYASIYGTPPIHEAAKAYTKGYLEQLSADGHEHSHYWVNRTKPYVQKGRYETEEQARQVDAQMRPFLESNGISFKEIGTDISELDKLVEEITA